MTAIEGHTELLPCPNPWCASTSALPAYSTRSEVWRVICACGVRTHGRPTEAEAVDLWNTRSPSHYDLVEALERADKLIDNLWEAVPWGQTFNLDIAALNEVPPAIKRALAQAKAGQ